MRLFIGIFPPKEYLDFFRDVGRLFSKEKRNLKMVPIDQVHLTLKFVGAAVSEKSASILIDSLKNQEGSYEKPSITLNRVSFGFPRQSRPNILLTLVKKEPRLIELAGQVHSVVRDLYRPDTINWKDKHFNAHFTMARLKKFATYHDGKRISHIVDNIKQPEGIKTFFPDEMHIVESELTRSGPTYRKLESIKL